MARDAITIKGIRQGLLIVLGEGRGGDRDWKGDLEALEERLGENPAFFRGGRVALDVGARELSVADIEAARALLSRHQVELWAVISASPFTESSAQSAGLVITLGPQRARERDVSAEGGEEPLADGLVVRRTLRSGQRLRHVGPIVVIGDVNPGAEVIAGGDIVVWGRVRGTVHAGALGDEGAVVCALDLAPLQLRIAGHIARSPEERRRKPEPEMALVRDGRIIATPWKGGAD